MPREPEEGNVVVEMAPPSRPRGRREARPRAPLAAARPEEASVREVLETLAAGRWTIAWVACAALALAVAHLLLAQRIYEADVVFRVEERRSGDLADLGERASPAAERTPAEIEIEIVRSRRLLAQVVDELFLDVEVHPRQLPLLGEALARWYRGDGPAPARLGIGGLAWGGERIRVDGLEVEPDLVDEPLRLTAMEGGRFRLATPDGGLLVEGLAGAPASSARATIRVAELSARPGTGFEVVKRLRADVVDELQEALRAEERGKKTGILVVRLEGPDPVRVAATLDAVSRVYLRDAVESRSAEAERRLEFLEAQLPVLKANLETAEAAVNAYQLRKGTVSLSAETTGLLTRAVEVEKELSALELRRTEVLQRFTAQHPEAVAIAEKTEQLRARRAGFEARLRALPSTELDSARLSRDVKVASELYLVLLNKAQEQRVKRSGIVGNVTVIDPARVPHRPARPRAPLVLALGLLLGLGGGVAAVLVRRALQDGADDPDQIEAATGLPVYVSIPHSPRQDELQRAGRRAPEARQPALAEAAPDDVAVEHLRSLRTALHVALMDARSHVIAVSSPSPGVGKSFLCVNIAHLLAAAGWSVLLVDADLRRGRLHRHFGLTREPGLSDVLRELAEPADAIRDTGVPNLKMLPSGRIPTDPAELLGSQQFQRLLGGAERLHDVVIIDTPPVLAVTDPVLVARSVGLTLLVLEARQHPISEIRQAVRRFALNGVRVQGVILNDVSPTAARYRRYPRVYEYRADRKGEAR
jgi:tyrosine-protein kinase Etk/Wzc